MKCVNGIDVDRLRATRDRIKADADGPFAHPRYESTIVWKNGFRTVSCAADGQEVIGDEPEQYGGCGDGITPEDMLLSAIGGCLVATYISGLSAAGITVKSLQLDVSGRVNFRAAFGLETGNPGYESIRVAVDIQTSSPSGKVKEIMDRLLKNAPIPDTIMRPVPLNVEISCRETEPAAQLT